MIGTWLRGLKPDSGVAARNHVHLRAECRNIERMQYVLRDQSHSNSFANGDVEIIDLPLSTGMLELPHPLLAHAIDVHRRLRRMYLLEEENGSPGKHHHGDAKRHQRPENLERNRAVDLHR